jgi:hypothetical protein
MPYGKPFTEEERKKRHKEKFGDLDDFPKERKGQGNFWKEFIEEEKTKKKEQDIWS